MQAPASASPPNFALPAGSRWVFGILLFAAVATTAYWVVWFFVDPKLLATTNDPAYFVFENAFPLADARLIACSVLATRALWRRRASALLWMLVGASASIYLGAMDVLFDLENGIYRAPTGDWVGVGIEVFINLATL